MQKPSIGRIVHYVLPDDSRHPGEARPAMIVSVHGDTCVNLHVFLDGKNDYDNPQDHEWQTSRLEGGPDQKYSWFWPPFVPPSK